MIKYADVNDIEWVIDLINSSELAYMQPTPTDIQYWIDQKSLLVDDTYHSMMQWKDNGDSITVNVALTAPEARNLGLSMMMFSYLWNTYRKPVFFNVVKDSEQEHYTALRNDIVKSRCMLIREFEVSNRVWRTYRSEDPNWKN
jgi:hypothetical protein